MRNSTIGLLAMAVVALMAGASDAALVMHSTMDDADVHRGATYPPPALSTADGNFTVDDATTNYDGVATGTDDPILSSATGKIGEAVDRTSHGRSYVEWPTVPDLHDGGDSFAFSLWVKATNTNGYDYMFIRGARHGQGFQVTASEEKGEFRVTGRDESDTTVGLEHSMVFDTQWNNIVGVFDADAGRLIAYINGAGSGTSGTDNGWSWSLDSTNQFDNTQDFDPGPTTDHDLRIAYRNGRPHQNDHVDGYYDDVAVWDDALSAGQARSLFTLADEEEMNYNASEAQALWDVMTSGTPATVGGKEWLATTALTGDPGDVLDLGGGDYALVLDANGGGVTTEQPEVIPEPASAMLVLLGLSGLGAYGRKRRRV